MRFSFFLTNLLLGLFEARRLRTAASVEKRGRFVLRVLPSVRIANGDLPDHWLFIANQRTGISRSEVVDREGEDGEISFSPLDTDLQWLSSGSPNGGSSVSIPLEDHPDIACADMPRAECGHVKGYRVYQTGTTDNDYDKADEDFTSIVQVFPSVTQGPEASTRTTCGIEPVTTDVAPSARYTSMLRWASRPGSLGIYVGDVLGGRQREIVAAKRRSVLISKKNAAEEKARSEMQELIASERAAGADISSAESDDRVRQAGHEAVAALRDMKEEMPFLRTPWRRVIRNRDMPIYQGTTLKLGRTKMKLELAWLSPSDGTVDDAIIQYFAGKKSMSPQQIRHNLHEDYCTICYDDSFTPDEPAVMMGEVSNKKQHVRHLGCWQKLIFDKKSLGNNVGEQGRSDYTMRESGLASSLPAVGGVPPEMRSAVINSGMGEAATDGFVRGFTIRGRDAAEVLRERGMYDDFVNLNRKGFIDVELVREFLAMVDPSPLLEAADPEREQMAADEGGMNYATKRRAALSPGEITSLYADNVLRPQKKRYANYMDCDMGQKCEQHMNIFAKLYVKDGDDFVPLEVDQGSKKVQKYGILDADIMPPICKAPCLIFSEFIPFEDPEPSSRTFVKRIYALKLHEEGEEERVYGIGRDDENTLQLGTHLTVSRQQTQLRYQPSSQSITITDIGSLFGTLIRHTTEVEEGEGAAGYVPAIPGTTARFHIRGYMYDLSYVEE